MRVRVTKKNILDGKPNSISSCPIALALKQLGKRNVGVDYDVAKWSGREATLPAKAQRFIERFDRGDDPLTLKPFTFNLHVRKTDG